MSTISIRFALLLVAVVMQGDAKEGATLSPPLSFDMSIPINIDEENRKAFLENREEEKRQAHYTVERLKAKTFPWAKVMAAVTAAGLLAAYLWLRNQPKLPIAVDKRKEVQERLDNLKGQQDDKLFFGELSQIIRSYYNLSHKTGLEFLRYMQNRLPPEQYRLISDIIDTAEKVQFDPSYRPSKNREYYRRGTQQVTIQKGTAHLTG